MNDPDLMSGVDSFADLRDDFGDFTERKGATLLRVFLEDVALGPLDGQEMDPAAGDRFADFYRPNDVGVLDSLTEACLAEKSRDGGFVRSKLLAKHLDRNNPMGGVLRAKDGGCSALSDLGIEGVARNGVTNQIFTWHGANLTVA